MKSKFYIGLVDSITEQKAISNECIDTLNSKLENLLRAWFLPIANLDYSDANNGTNDSETKVFSGLAVEIVILSSKTNYQSCPILKHAEQLGVTIETVPTADTTAGNIDESNTPASSMADFLAAKCSMVLIMGEHIFEQANHYKNISTGNDKAVACELNDLIKSNTLTTNIFNAILVPEFTADQHQDYYFNSNENLPFLYQVETCF